MKLQLTEWQRLVIFQLLENTTAGPLSLLRKAAKVQDALERNGEIPTKANPKVLESRAEVEINDREAIRLLKEKVRNFNGWPYVALAQVEDLFTQLEINSEEGTGDETEGEPERNRK